MMGFLVAVASLLLAQVWGRQEEQAECLANSGQATKNASVRTAPNGELWLEHERDVDQQNGSTGCRVEFFGIECCYSWVTTSGAVEADVSLEPAMLEHALDTPVRLFKRSDDLPFFAGFDFEADRFALRRNADKYNVTKRFKLVAQQTMEETPIPFKFLPRLNTSRVFALGENKGVGDHLGYDSTWLYSADKGASFHFKYAPTRTVITVLQGSLGVLTVPAANLSLTRPYPVVHPLHAQSSIDVKRKKFQNLTAQAFELHAGRQLTLEPQTPYRLISLADKAVWLVSDVIMKGDDLISVRRRAYDGLPKYLKPNALVGQPLFFGMWTLAIYFDALLGVDARNATERVMQRESLTHLTQLLMDRWGPDSPRLGHADDFRDFGLQAEEVIDNVEAECLEMQHTPKDLMLSQRAEVEDETLSSAHKNRKGLLAFTGSDPKNVHFAFMALEHMEMAVSNTLGGCAIRQFFTCYFGYKLTRD